MHLQIYELITYSMHWQGRQEGCGMPPHFLRVCTHTLNTLA